MFNFLQNIFNKVSEIVLIFAISIGLVTIEPIPVSKEEPIVSIPISESPSTSPASSTPPAPTVKPTPKKKPYIPLAPIVPKIIPPVPPIVQKIEPSPTTLPSPIIETTSTQATLTAEEFTLSYHISDDSILFTAKGFRDGFSYKGWFTFEEVNNANPNLIFVKKFDSVFLPSKDITIEPIEFSTKFILSELNNNRKGYYTYFYKFHLERSGAHSESKLFEVILK